MKPARQTSSTPLASSAVTQRLLEVRLRDVMGPVIDHAMGQARLCGPREPEGIGPVGEHERNLARGIGTGAVVDEGLQIGPAARDQDAHSQPRHVAPLPPSGISPMTAAGRLAPGPMIP